jgi:molybdopterin-guanine dinucleotide biosynthesis protein
MRPLVIGVAGAHSGSGKTHAARLILERLPGWGAIKCTPSSIYTALTDDPAALAEEGKDTALMLRAGAAEALWVRATPRDMNETLRLALDRLSHLPGVVVEGNSAIEVLSPDIVIFMAGEPDRLKQSAVPILSRADIVIIRGDGPAGLEPGIPVFPSDRPEGFLQRVTEMVTERVNERAGG